MGQSAWGSPFARSIIRDTDGDTKVETEKNPDEDIVRITAGGVEGGKFYNSGIVDFAGQSACSAYLGSNQSINNTTWTKLQIDTENYDVQNEFDPVTNYRFTAISSGKYIVAMLVGTAEAIADGQGQLAGLYKNGAYFASSKSSAPKATSLTSFLTVELELSANDYLEFFVWQNHGSARNMLAGASNTWFTVHKLS